MKIKEYYFKLVSLIYDIIFIEKLNCRRQEIKNLSIKFKT